MTSALADKFLPTAHLIKGSLCLCVLFPGPTAHQTLRIWLRQDSASDILARVYIGVRPGQPRGKGTKDRAGDCQRCTLWCVCVNGVGRSSQGARPRVGQDASVFATHHRCMMSDLATFHLSSNSVTSTHPWMTHAGWEGKERKKKHTHAHTRTHTYTPLTEIVRQNEWRKWPGSNSLPRNSQVSSASCRLVITLPSMITQPSWPSGSSVVAHFMSLGTMLWKCCIWRCYKELHPGTRCRERYTGSIKKFLKGNFQLHSIVLHCMCEAWRQHLFKCSAVSVADDFSPPTRLPPPTVAPKSDAGLRCFKHLCQVSGPLVLASSAMLLILLQVLRTSTFQPTEKYLFLETSWYRNILISYLNWLISIRKNISAYWCGPA